MHAALLLALPALFGAAPEQWSSRDFLRMVVATGGELVIQRKGQPSEFVDFESDLPNKVSFSLSWVDAVGSTLDDLRPIVSLPPFDGLTINARQLNSANARAFRALRRLPNLVVEGAEHGLITIEHGPPIQGLEEARIFSATIGKGVVSLLANPKTLESVLFHGCQLQEGVLAELRGARALRWLGVAGATDADLNDLPPLESLRVLAAGDRGRIGPGLAALARQPALRTLNLDGRQIDVTHLRSLANVARLEELYLDRSNISDEAASVLATLHRVRVLSLGATAITDKGVRALAAMPCLETLTLNETGVSNASIQILKAFPALRSLDLFVAGVGVEGLKSMEDFQTLERLNVYVTVGEFGDEQAEALAQIPRLKDLSLGPARLTAVGVRTLGSNTTLESLRLFGQPIDASVLGELTRLVRLKQLTLCSTGADDAAVRDSLRSKLPKCAVTVLP